MAEPAPEIPDDVPPAPFERHLLSDDPELEALVNQILESEQTYGDEALDPCRYPDATEAAEYFDEAEQYSEIEVVVEHESVEATIAGEQGYRWWVRAECPVFAGRAEQAIATPEGFYVDGVDEDKLFVRGYGCYEDHDVVYERVRELLESIANYEPDPRVAAGVVIAEEVGSDSVWGDV